MAQELQLKTTDKIKLKAIVEELSSFANSSASLQSMTHVIIDQEEQEAMLKMENKLKNMENLVEINVQTTQNCDDTMKECQISIKDTFAQIRDVSDERRKYLMDTLQTLTQNQQNTLISKNEELNDNIKNMKERIQRCHQLLHETKAISVQDMKIRKQKIISISNEDIEQKENDDKVDDGGLSKICIDLSQAFDVIESIKCVGTLSIDPVPMIINIENNHTDFNVKIDWRLSTQQNDDDDDDGKIQENNMKKLKVEWYQKQQKQEQEDEEDEEKNDEEEDEFDDDDAKKEEENMEWKSVEFENMCPTQENSSVSVNVECNGLFLFQILYFNGVRWSKNSNIKYIEIADVVLMDKWEPKLKSMDLMIDGSSIVHSDDRSSRCSAYLSNTVEHGMSHWKFLIEKFEKVSGWRQEIGVWKCNESNTNHSDMIFDGYFTSQEHFCYAFRFDGSLANPYRKYGSEWHENDEIDMFLDLDAATLGYCINGTYLGIAFDVTPNCKYRAAVDIYRKGNRIKLLSFDHNPPPPPPPVLLEETEDDK